MITKIVKQATKPLIFEFDRLYWPVHWLNWYCFRSFIIVEHLQNIMTFDTSSWFWNKKILIACYFLFKGVVLLRFIVMFLHKTAKYIKSYCNIFLNIDIFFKYNITCYLYKRSCLIKIIWGYRREVIKAFTIYVICVRIFPLSLVFGLMLCL